MTSLLRTRLGPHARTFGFSVILWVFGLSTSILLIGLWGRSVATDPATLETSARAVLESEIVNERVTDWLTDGIAAAGDFSPDDIAAAVSSVESSPELQRVLNDLVDQAVAAALAPPGATARIEVTEALDELIPVISGALEASGVDTGADALQAAVRDATDIVLSSDDQAIVTSTANSARVLLTKVLIVGLTGMVLSGGAALALSNDRERQLRGLTMRVAVSAVTFAIILRVGGWAVNPSGGRSPIAAGGAVLLGSNGHVLAFVAAGATVVAAAVSLLILRRRATRTRAPARIIADADPTTGPDPDPGRIEEDLPTTEQPILAPAGS